MAHEFVFTMQDVSRVVGEGRVILEDITLAFFPGAKIGVLGHNGAGKSSLLRIMAGLDDEFTGEAKPAAGVRVGFLPQEPELDPEKDVMGNVEEGVGEVVWDGTDLNGQPAPKGDYSFEVSAEDTDGNRLQARFTCNTKITLFQKVVGVADAPLNGCAGAE